MIDSIAANLAKILLVLGLIFIIMKALGKRESGLYDKLYILHKAGPGLATILAFVHGLTVVPLNQTYVVTGWLLGVCMILLLVMGVYLGFQSEWIPFDHEKDAHFKKIRVLKWLLTVLVIASLAAHYLIVEF